MTAATAMRPRISVVTLGVTDVERSVRFYRDGLGLPIREDKPPVVYFELDGAWLALYPRARLASFAGLDGMDAAAPVDFAGVTLSVNVDSRADVDATVLRAEAAGARVTRAPREFSWGGYAGWFADPDSHLWEIVHNPRPFA